MRLLRSCLVGLSLLCYGSRNAEAVSITFDNAFTITDNLAGFDLNPALGVIDFDSTSSGPLTTSGYEVKGRVTTLATGNTSIMANATSVLTLTNFVADTGTALPGQNVIIDFSHTFTAAGVVNAVAALDALTANGFGQPLFANGASSNSVPFGLDTINDWYGYVSGQLVVAPVSGGPLPLSNPALPAGGGSLPYGLYSQGPQPMGFFAPVVGGYLDFTLGGARDQLLLPSSAQVGFWAVPEPASGILLGIGALGLLSLRAVRRRRQI